DALVLHALVLAAQALVVLDRPEDARAEQAVAFRLERAVVDRLRLLDLAVGPRENLVRARDRDPDLVEDLRRNLRAEKIHHFLVHLSLRFGGQRTDDGRQISAASIVKSGFRSPWSVFPLIRTGYSDDRAWTSVPSRPPSVLCLLRGFGALAAAAGAGLLRIVQVDIETERAHLLDQHV